VVSAFTLNAGSVLSRVEAKLTFCSPVLEGQSTRLDVGDQLVDERLLGGDGFDPDSLGDFVEEAAFVMPQHAG